MGARDIIQSRKDTYYWNVYLFIDRIKDITSIQDSELVHSNLSTCLRGSAQKWYFFELTQLERDALQELDEGVTEWIKALKKRFKPSISVCMVTLTTEKYTMTDTKNHWEPVNFVQSVVHHMKSAGFDTTKAQLTYAWNQLEVELHWDISEPSDEISLIDFIQIMKFKKQIWFELTRHSKVVDWITNNQY